MRKLRVLGGLSGHFRILAQPYGVRIFFVFPLLCVLCGSMNFIGGLMSYRSPTSRRVSQLPGNDTT